MLTVELFQAHSWCYKLSSDVNNHFIPWYFYLPISFQKCSGERRGGSGQISNSVLASLTQIHKNDKPIKISSPAQITTFIFFHTFKTLERFWNYRETESVNICVHPTSWIIRKYILNNIPRKRTNMVVYWMEFHFWAVYAVGT